MGNIRKHKSASDVHHIVETEREGEKTSDRAAVFENDQNGEALRQPVTPKNERVKDKGDKRTRRRHRRNEGKRR